MARINLEDQFWLEIIGVAIAMGSQDLAVGNAVRFFRHAQEKAKAGKYLSEDEFKHHGFTEALFPSFAVRTTDGIQAAGFDKHFGWLAKRVEAGRKGGSKPKQTKANVSKRSKGKQPEPSPSPSPSYSPSPSDSPSSSSLDTAAAIAAYCERFKIRWGVNPQIQGKDAGIMGRLAKGMTPSRLAYLLDAYFSMPDAGVVKAKHPINFLELKMNEVVVFADSGNFTTTTQARQADQMASNHMLMEKLKREGK